MTCFVNECCLRRCAEVFLFDGRGSRNGGAAAAAAEEEEEEEEEARWDTKEHSTRSLHDFSSKHCATPNYHRTSHPLSLIIRLLLVCDDLRARDFDRRCRGAFYN